MTVEWNNRSIIRHSLKFYIIRLKLDLKNYLFNIYKGTSTFLKAMTLFFFKPKNLSENLMFAMYLQYLKFNVKKSSI